MVEKLISNIERDGEQRRLADHGQAFIADAGALALMRATFEPGWRWSEHVKAVAGTDSCQVRHLGHVLSGTMHIRMDDGTEFDVGEGDLFDLAPGHDAWVTGDVPCEIVDVSPDATRYATAARATQPADDRFMTIVRRGYAAFNTGDMDTLREIFASDVVQHVPGTGQLAGTYKGVDGVLAYYGKVFELTDGTFRAHPLQVYGDGHGHVTAVHQATATRNGEKRVSQDCLLFTFAGEKVTDVLEMHADQPGDDAFFG